MDLLAQPAEETTYQDVVEFCDEKIGESTVLDYKRETPKDLAKHIAAMSNRFGGLIIVGVEEDKQTGIPRVYEGVPNDGKLVERANQLAYNVRPLPTCVVRSTNEVNGKVFLLVRVYEGGAAPYTTVNDPTVYLRTGNMTTPLRSADTENLRDLFAKRAEAESLQAANVARASVRLQAVIERRDAAHAQRLSAQAEAEGRSLAPTATLAESFQPVTAYLQPFYPRHDLAAPWDLEAKLPALRLHSATNGRYFPEQPATPIADGVLCVQGGQRDYGFWCDQVYANGFFWHAENSAGPQLQRGHEIHLQDIAHVLYRTLRFGQRLYPALGYSGLLRGAVGLTKAKGRTVRIIVVSERAFDNTIDFDRPVAIDDEYSWLIEADTHRLGDDQWLHQYFKQLMRKIYWDLGYSEFRPQLLDAFVTGLQIQ